MMNSHFPDVSGSFTTFGVFKTKMFIVTCNIQKLVTKMSQLGMQTDAVVLLCCCECDLTVIQKSNLLHVLGITIATKYSFKLHCFCSICVRCDIQAY